MVDMKVAMLENGKVAQKVAQMVEMKAVSKDGLPAVLTVVSLVS